MIARAPSPSHLTPFQFTLMTVPRQHLCLYLDLSKHDRSCVERLWKLGHSFDDALFIVVSVPDGEIDYTPVNPTKKDSP